MYFKASWLSFFFGFEFSLQLWDWWKDAKDGDSARPEEENRKISRWTGSAKDQAEVPILASLFLKSGWDLAEWLERLTANAEVATVPGSVPASFDTVESEGRQLQQC